MLLKYKINKMALLWIIVIITGTCLTIWGTYELSKEWSKKDILRQSHTTPDFILFDCEAEVELDENLRDSILKEALSKISGLGKMDSVPLFFDEVSAGKNKNYSIDNSVCKIFSEIGIKGLLIAKDSSIILDLNSKSDNMTLSVKSNNLENSIEVREYNGKTNRFKILYRNILMDVSSNSISQFIIDLDKGEMTLDIITKPTLKIKEIRNIVFKTKKTEYFRVKKLYENKLGGYNAELVLTLR